MRENPGSEVRVRAVSKTLGSSPSRSLRVVEDVSFDADPGEFICILGPSGCGKTTLLKIIGGLLLPDDGEVYVAGNRVDGPGFDRALVFQNFRLLPWKTVLENVEFGLKARNESPKVRRETAIEIVKLVGLDEFVSYYPHQLSGGMQQRVALARALATKPSVLLMDEPLSSLDAQTREILQGELLKIWEKSRKTILFVTHSVDEAIYLGQRIVVLSPRPSRVAEIVPVDIPQPRWQFEVWRDSAYLQLKSKIAAMLKFDYRAAA